MSHFDPWTATLEQAVAQPYCHETRGAVDQWAGAQQLIREKERILSGRGFDVLEAVATCALHALVQPDWLAKAYLKRYRAVLQCKVGSWDAEEAFGRPYPKGTNIAARKHLRYKDIAVSNAVRSAIESDPTRAIDTEFWEDIGKSVDVGKTGAQEQHAKAVKRGLTVPAELQKKGVNTVVENKAFTEIVALLNLTAPKVSPANSVKLAGIKKD
jgi:hypothetical protein